MVPRRGKHQEDPRENKTNGFPRDYTLTVYYLEEERYRYVMISTEGSRNASIKANQLHNIENKNGQ